MKKSIFVSRRLLYGCLRMVLAAHAHLQPRSCSPAATEAPAALKPPLHRSPCSSSQSWFADGIRQSCSTVLQ